MREICPTKIFRKFSRVNSGFTLVELLIATSIMGILFSLGMAQYMKFNRQQVLDQAVLELKTNLHHAQNMALAGKKECTEGAFDGILVKAIDDERYQISSSCNKGAQTTEIGEYKVPQGIRRTGGLEDPGILFKPLTGGTNLSDDETITLTFRSEMTGEVKVTPSGKIELVSE